MAHPLIISIVIHRAMEFAIHQEDDEGMEMQPAYFGGVLHKCLMFQLGNRGVNSPPSSKPSKNPKLIPPKKKNRFGRTTKKGRNKNP